MRRSSHAELLLYFRTDHAHAVDGFTYDKDIVVEIEAEDEAKARVIMSDYFGLKWAFCYLEIPDMKYFPRGTKKLQQRRQVINKLNDFDKKNLLDFIEEKFSAWEEWCISYVPDVSSYAEEVHNKLKEETGS